MNYLDKYIKNIKQFEEYAKDIASCYPVYTGKDHSFSAIYGQIVKYWDHNGASTKIKSHFDFQKPRNLKEYMNRLIDGEDGCPVMYVENSKNNLCIAVLRVVSAENTKVPPIKSRSGKMVQPYLLDLSGKIVKTVEPKKVTTWSVATVFEVIFQTLFFNEVLPELDKEEFEKAQNKFNSLYAAAKEKKMQVEEEHKHRPYLRIVSVPMGGMNKYRK